MSSFSGLNFPEIQTFEAQSCGTTILANNSTLMRSKDAKEGEGLEFELRKQ